MASDRQNKKNTQTSGPKDDKGVEPYWQQCNVTKNVMMSKTYSENGEKRNVKLSFGVAVVGKREPQPNTKKRKEKKR